MSTNTLEMFVIYAHPSDYPNGFVVRRSVIGGDRKCPTCAADQPHVNDRCPLFDMVAQYAPTLEAARALVPPFKTLVPPFPGEDPAIAEVWL